MTPESMLHADSHSSSTRGVRNRFRAAFEDGGRANVSAPVQRNRIARGIDSQRRMVHRTHRAADEARAASHGIPRAAGGSDNPSATAKKRTDDSRRNREPDVENRTAVQTDALLAAENATEASPSAIGRIDATRSTQSGRPANGKATFPTSASVSVIPCYLRATGQT